MVPPVALVELCQAHHWVAKPLIDLPCGVKTMYVVFGWLPKCAASRLAALAMSVWVGLLGTVVVSFQVPLSWPVTFWMYTALVTVVQFCVPEGTFWQYWVTTLFQLVPPTPLKKSVVYV